MSELSFVDQMSVLADGKWLDDDGDVIEYGYDLIYSDKDKYREAKEK